MGKISAEFISFYDIILRKMRNSTTFMGGILIIGSLDHLQIQPINRRLFFKSSSINPCLKIISLKHYVRATGSEYIQLQSLVRRDYRDFDRHPIPLQKFRDVCSKIFTFVDNWDNLRVTSNTCRIFRKKNPVKTALDEFLLEEYSNNMSRFRRRSCEDCQK